MSLVQLEVDDMLIQAIGLQTVQDFFERQLAMLRLKYLSDEIVSAIRQAGMDHFAEVEAARKEAWLEAKAHMTMKIKY